MSKNKFLPPPICTPRYLIHYIIADRCIEVISSGLNYYLCFMRLITLYKSISSSDGDGGCRHGSSSSSRSCSRIEIAAAIEGCRLCTALQHACDTLHEMWQNRASIYTFKRFKWLKLIHVVNDAQRSHWQNDNSQ